MIPVTKSFLPPIEEYTAQVQRAYNNSWLTNRGELVLELESKLKEYLGVSNILITNNGTIPLQIALHSPMLLLQRQLYGKTACLFL